MGGDEDPILGNSEDQAGSRERACYISVMPDTISISSPCTVYYYSIQAMKTVPKEVSNGKFSRPDAIKVGSSVQMKFKASVSSRQTSSREIQAVDTSGVTDISIVIAPDSNNFVNFSRIFTSPLCLVTNCEMNCCWQINDEWNRRGWDKDRKG